MTPPKTKPPSVSQNPKSYSLGEEIANAVTHGIGTGLSVAGLTLLVVLAILSLIILYLASTLYHSFQNPPVKRVFRIIDHSAIYLLIAGTYTPFLLLCVRGAWRWALLGVVWGLALLGIGFKAFFTNRFRKISVLAYILMGWLCVIALREMLATIPSGGLILLAVGGAIYTVGIIFYVWRRVPYNHAIWHLFVMGGSICHYVAILLYLTPVA